MAAGAAQDLHRWVARAVELTRLPAVGSEVYYFHQGHADQFSLPAPQADQPMLPCTVTSIFRFTAVEEPYARISLLPGNHSDQPAADTRPDPDSFHYYPKPLSQSDIQRSYLVVPNLCAQSMFPALEVRNNTQPLHMLDLNGEPYEFEHKAVPKHNLGGDWGKFVRLKGVGVGDSMVFIRGGDQSLMIESRPQQPLANLWLQEPLEELTVSSEFATLGVPFTVTYYPGRRSGSPFVVPRGAVDEAMCKQWESGMQVRMRPSDLVLRAGDTHGATLEDTTGTINAVTPSLVWRNIQIDLDGSSSSSPSATKNMWEVESVRAQPPVAKRTKTATDPGLSHDDQSKEPVKALRLMGFDIKAKEDIDTVEP
ncbi:hypothetical protein ACQ4PT_054137 [Festuca glaucescens]